MSPTVTEHRLSPHLTQRLSTALGTGIPAARVFRGSAIDTAANGLNARAFTAAANIYLPSATGALDTPESEALLAHELAHVVQQQQLGPVASESSYAGANLERAARGVEAGIRGRLQSRHIGPASRSFAPGAAPLFFAAYSALPPAWSAPYASHPAAGQTFAASDMPSLPVSGVQRAPLDARDAGAFDDGALDSAAFDTLGSVDTLDSPEVDASSHGVPGTAAEPALENVTDRLDLAAWESPLPDPTSWAGFEPRPLTHTGSDALPPASWTSPALDAGGSFAFSALAPLGSSPSADLGLMTLPGRQIDAVAPFSSTYVPQGEAGLAPSPLAADVASISQRLTELGERIEKHVVMADDLDAAALANRLFYHLHARLRSELTFERERSGRLTGI
ncbi:MAG: DUF4157 domain-containing protein [Actinomycetota bacterium]|nr:DUF4157 domain-containing protein [Actinomycetota bacterium]